MSASTFPRFLELPTELQIKIWDHAIEQTDVVELLEDLEYFHEEDNPHQPRLAGPWTENCFSWYRQKDPPDAILLHMHVCHLSRQVFLKKWRSLLTKVPVSNKYWRRFKQLILGILGEHILQDDGFALWWNPDNEADTNQEIEMQGEYLEHLEHLLNKKPSAELEAKAAKVRERLMAVGLEDFMGRMEPARPAEGNQAAEEDYEFADHEFEGWYDDVWDDNFDVVEARKQYLAGLLRSLGEKPSAELQAEVERMRQLLMEVNLETSAPATTPQRSSDDKVAEKADPEFDADKNDTADDMRAETEAEELSVLKAKERTEQTLIGETERDQI